MRRHKTRRTASNINIPCAANIQACAVGRGQPPVHDIASTVRRDFGFNDFIFTSQTKQSIRQLFPFHHRETKPEKKPCFASASRMRRIEQILSDLSFRHCGQFGIRQFHFQTKIVCSRAGPMEAINSFASVKPAMAFRYSRAFGGRSLNLRALSVGVRQPSNST